MYEVWERKTVRVARTPVASLGSMHGLVERVPPGRCRCRHVLQVSLLLALGARERAASTVSQGEWYIQSRADGRDGAVAARLREVADERDGKEDGEREVDRPAHKDTARVARRLALECDRAQGVGSAAGRLGLGQHLYLELRLGLPIGRVLLCVALEEGPLAQVHTPPKVLEHRLTHL